MAVEHRNTGKWYATITHKGKKRYLGSFGTEVAAREAFREADLERLVNSDAMFTYRLRSPDFLGLREKDIAFATGIPANTLQSRMRGLKKKLPQLFPLYPKSLLSGMNSGLVCCPVSYEPKMDAYIKQKF